MYPPKFSIVLLLILENTENGGVYASSTVVCVFMVGGADPFLVSEFCSFF